MNFRFVEIDGLVRVMLEIGDKTTHQKLRDTISFVLKLRDQVQDGQSKKIATELYHKMLRPSNKEELLELLSLSCRNMVFLMQSWRTFNGNIVNLLERYLIIHQKDEISNKELIEESELISFANNLLNALSVIDINLDDALEQMKAGMPPI